MTNQWADPQGGGGGGNYNGYILGQTPLEKQLVFSRWDHTALLAKYVHG